MRTNAQRKGRPQEQLLQSFLSSIAKWEKHCLSQRIKRGLEIRRSHMQTNAH